MKPRQLTFDDAKYVSELAKLQHRSNFAPDREKLKRRADLKRLRTEHLKYELQGARQ